MHSGREVGQELRFEFLVGVVSWMSLVGMSRSRPSQFRRWCFTLNNYTVADLDRLNGMVKAGEARFLGYGKEIAPTTGTPHLQAYIERYVSQYKSGIVKFLPYGCHVEPAALPWDSGAFFSDEWDGWFGNQEVTDGEGWPDNMTYVCKDGDFYLFGTPGGDGADAKRSDLDNFVEAVEVKAGKISDYDVIVTHRAVSAKYLRWAQEVKRVVGIQKNVEDAVHQTAVLYFHGPPGTGKTHQALNMVDQDHKDGRVLSSWVMPPKDCKEGKLWFDGYNHEDVIILDDFVGQVPVLFMLHLFDGNHKYARVQVKNAHLHIKPKMWIMTSNSHPDDLYKVCFAARPDLKDAFWRRVSGVAYFGKVFEGVEADWRKKPAFLDVPLEAEGQEAARKPTVQDIRQTAPGHFAAQALAALARPAVAGGAAAAAAAVVAQDELDDVARRAATQHAEAQEEHQRATYALNHATEMVTRAVQVAPLYVDLDDEEDAAPANHGDEPPIDLEDPELIDIEEELLKTEETL